MGRLMADGMKEPPKHFEAHGRISLLLNVLLSCLNVFSDTTLTLSSSIPNTELAFLNRIFSLFVPQLTMPPPLHATVHKITQTTTNW